MSFPDVNVWLALLMADHIHRPAAIRWWETTNASTIAFCRSTQVSVLRVLTTATAMNGKPLTMAEAWAAYDRLFEDDRICFMSEPAVIEDEFRALARLTTALPKLWADAYLAAFARVAGATLVTFDRALSSRADDSLLLDH
ncbi:MAG: PIN domain-containing protein [Bryobacterales bacterium]|nr:PIN domain-containing protein [Bryobacterales bacterium]